MMDEADPPAVRRQRALLTVASVAVLATATTAAHHRVVLNQFVNVDDPLYVLSNPRVQEGLTAGGTAWAFTTFHAYNWHPLTWLSHMLDAEMYGLEPSGHHATNLILHVANAVLLFLFLRKATGAHWRSLAAAALFGLHPIHVESVAWISERKDVLSTVFGLAVLWLYVGTRAPIRPARYLGMLACFSASLLAKPMLVTLPVLLLVLDYWPLERWKSAAPGSPRPLTPARLVLEKAPFLAISAASAVITYLAQRRGGAVLHESPLWLNAGNAALSYVRYLGKLFWPADLAIVYPFRPMDVTPASVAGAIAVLAGISSAAYLLRKSHPWLIAGWLWFLVALLPVIGFVRIGRHALADRYSYVPFVGLYVALTWEAARVASRLRLPRWLQVLACAIVLSLLSALTVLQVERWRTSVTLLEHAIRVTRDNALAHKNLGLALRWQGDPERADRESLLGRMLEQREIAWLHPGNPDAQYGLGNSLMDLDRYGEAVECFQEAVRLRPSFARAHNDLGIAYARLGRLEDALAALSRARRADPDFLPARENAATIERLLEERKPGATAPGVGVGPRGAR